MNAERWAVIEELFTRALELEPAERAAFLERAEPDAELRAEVERLLAGHEEDPAFLEGAAWLHADAIEEPLPERVGRYRILRVLGRGGMGQVYLAEREAPDFRQRVALKVLRRGLDTADFLRRFHLERQILATLTHANIARVFDVGSTDDGLPYLVMEYVEGTSILDYCDDRRLGLADRLRLFQEVCAAVHHAHQSLVVHRDLKPGNILVTADGMPKLLDFGIAKVLDAGGAEGETGLTAAGIRLLTPEYSSPEQLRGDPVTTACDVYALGVLLHELLAGRHPARRKGRSRAELERWVLEEDPTPPSAALRAGASELEAIAMARGSTPAQLRWAVAGDLDAIVLKALRRQPEDRYASALGLSEDVDRHLAGLPVNARRATIGYELRKFVRRYRVPVAAAAAVLLLLLGSYGMTLRQARRIEIEAARTERERDKALEVRSFLLEMFGATGPDQPTGATVTVRDLLDRRAATVEEAYGDDPELMAEVMIALADAYERLDLFDAAEPLARRSLEVRRELFGPDHADVVSSGNLLGWLVYRSGDAAAAEPLLAEAVRAARTAFPAGDDDRLARALNDLGIVLEARGSYDDAAALFHESLNARRLASGEESVGVGVTLSNLGANLYRRGDYTQAATVTAEAVALFERLLGPDHQRTLVARSNLAVLWSVAGDQRAAAEQHRAILEQRRRVLGPRHPGVATALHSLAAALLQAGDAPAAKPHAREATEILADAGGGTRDRVIALRVLGSVYVGLDRHEDALAAYESGVGILRTARDADPQELALLLMLRARSLTARGRLEEAELAYRESERHHLELLPETHHWVADTRLELVDVLLRQERHGEAGDVLARAEAALPEAGTTRQDYQERARTARAALEAAVAGTRR